MTDAEIESRKTTAERVTSVSIRCSAMTSEGREEMRTSFVRMSCDMGNETSMSRETLVAEGKWTEEPVAFRQ